MRVTPLLPTLIFAIAAAGPQGKHWAETPDETIWRAKIYGNCDHGYFVNLPPGVIGHGSRSPSPNHGIAISAKNPSTTTQVTLRQQARQAQRRVLPPEVDEARPTLA